MCLPLAAVAAVGTVIAAGAAVAGTVVQMKGQASAANAQVQANNSTAEFNAQTRTFQAGDTRRAAEIEVGKSWDAYQRVKGQANVAAASSGFSSRSFSDIFADNSAEASLERMSIRDSAYKDQFYLQRQTEGDVASVTAENRSTVTAANYNMIGSAIGGVGQLAKVASAGASNGTFTTIGKAFA